MGTTIGGYRQSLLATLTASTHVLNFDPIGAGHKVYLEQVAAEADKANADFEFAIVSGGAEHPFALIEAVTANLSEAAQGAVWIYPGEHVRVNASGLGADYKIKAWLLGVDKWEKDGT